MNTLLEQIKMQDAAAFTHGGKFHADDVFLPHYFYILILKSQSPVEIKFLKILRELFLILEGANTIITSATAVSVKMVFLMPHSVFYGKNLGQKFSVKNLP